MKKTILCIIFCAFAIFSTAQTDSNAIKNLNAEIEKLDNQINDLVKQKQTLVLQKNVLEQEEKNKQLKIDEATVTFLNDNQVYVNHKSKMVTVMIYKISFSYEWSKEEKEWRLEEGEKELVMMVENYNSGSVLTFQVKNDFTGDFEILAYNKDGKPMNIVAITNLSDSED